MSSPTTGASVPDRPLQRYLRTAAARGRDAERVGPFVALFDPHTAHPYLNYAIPDDGARPTPSDVAALIAAFDRRGRVPRLEYLPAVAPEAEAALLSAGLTVQDRLPLMVCTPDTLVAPSPQPGLEIALPVGDDDLRAMGVAQHAAFGDGPPDAAAANRLREWIAEGAIAVVARDVASGAIVGGGIATVPDDGTTEVAGIGVLEAFRRRGAAGAITARLAREAFARGVTTAFLTPGDDGAQRVYARAGFAERSVMLHLVRPGS